MFVVIRNAIALDLTNALICSNQNMWIHLNSFSIDCCEPNYTVFQLENFYFFVLFTQSSRRWSFVRAFFHILCFIVAVAIIINIKVICGECMPLRIHESPKQSHGVLWNDKNDFLSLPTANFTSFFCSSSLLAQNSLTLISFNIQSTTSTFCHTLALVQVNELEHKMRATKHRKYNEWNDNESNNGSQWHIYKSTQIHFTSFFRPISIQRMAYRYPMQRYA